MSDVKLWTLLKTEDLVQGDMPEADAEQESTLWYLRILQGFAGWLAAVFLIGFLGVGVAGLFEHGLGMVVLGLVINASTYVFFKTKPASDFFEQLALAFSLTGQFLFAFGLFEWFEFRDKQWLLLVGFYQVILVFVMNHYLHRFLSAWFAVIAFFWGYEVLVYSGLGSALVAALFVWMWLDKAGWESDKNFYEPVAYALGFSLIQLNIQSQFWLFVLFSYQRNEVSWLIQNAYWVSALLNTAVLIYFVSRMVKEHRINLSTTTGRLVILATVVLLFSALPVIGLSSSLLVLLVGFARQNRLLLVMGTLALLWYVGWYYYSLDATLLYKSMILMVIGVVLLLGAVLLKYGIEPTDEASVSDDGSVQVESFGLSAWQKVAAALTLVMGLVGVNHAIWQKEQVLKTGQSVLLELAPVDPRSIMQGDYMRLRFAMAQQIRANLPVPETPARNNILEGYVWVKLDDRGVGQFHSLDIGSRMELDKEQGPDDSLLKLQFRIRNNRVQFATNAFFFQEGDANLFNAARFGQFKVAEDGELLLSAMHDENLILLGLNRMD